MTSNQDPHDPGRMDPYIKKLPNGEIIPVGGRMALKAQKEFSDKIAVKLYQPSKKNPDLTVLDDILDSIIADATDGTPMVRNAARGELFDRLLGKAKQSIESVNVNLTLEDFLKKVADEESWKDVIDV